MNINEVLHEIQQKLKAPKNQYNSFGKYNYRSCEDILEAVKPLLPEGYVILLSDRMVNIGQHNYIEATATLQNSESSTEVTAYAKEAESQKGMNDSQLTGSTSSYARKYALNGLLLIDDTKDSDATNKHGKEQYSTQEVIKILMFLNDNDPELASNHLHELTGKSKSSELTESDILTVMPKLIKLKSQKESE